jgi:hypothetical protein
MRGDERAQVHVCDTVRCHIHAGDDARETAAPERGWHQRTVPVDVAVERSLLGRCDARWRRCRCHTHASTRRAAGGAPPDQSSMVAPSLTATATRAAAT